MGKINLQPKWIHLKNKQSCRFHCGTKKIQKIKTKWIESANLKETKMGDWCLKVDTGGLFVFYTR